MQKCATKFCCYQYTIDFIRYEELFFYFITIPSLSILLKDNSTDFYRPNHTYVHFYNTLQKDFFVKKTVPHPSLDNNSYLIDTHCHLDMDAYDDDLNDVIEHAKQLNIRNIITIGVDIPSSIRALKIAQHYPAIYATIGVHPHEVDNLTDNNYEELRTLHQSDPNNIIGYGEIGLDYVKLYSKPTNQRTHFSRQLELAHELGLPVVIHNREAEADTLTILESQAPFTNSGIMHCFSGDYAFANRIIDLGMLISIPGIVTFKNATKLHEVVQKIPLEHMVVETDGPFLSPHPYRGKRNEPAHVLFTAAKIAEIKNLALEEVAYQTSLNATKLFNLPSPYDTK